jgi:hypothetical protein
MPSSAGRHFPDQSAHMQPFQQTADRRASATTVRGVGGHSMQGLPNCPAVWTLAHRRDTIMSAEFDSPAVLSSAGFTRRGESRFRTEPRCETAN